MPSGLSMVFLLLRDRHEGKRVVVDLVTDRLTHNMAGSWRIWLESQVCYQVVRKLKNKIGTPRPNMFEFTCTLIYLYPTPFSATFTEQSDVQSISRSIQLRSTVRNGFFTGKRTEIDWQNLFDDKLDENAFLNNEKEDFCDFHLNERSDLFPWHEFSILSPDGADGGDDRSGGDSIPAGSNFFSVCGAWKAFQKLEAVTT